ncbi:MAG: carboxypeptidase-like regulatory domain-containing protein [Pirellulaceae bacterium]
MNTRYLILSVFAPLTVLCLGSAYPWVAADEPRLFELIIVDMDQQPIPHVQVEIRGNPRAQAAWVVEGVFKGQVRYGSHVLTNQDGRLKLRIPAGARPQFKIEAVGYGPYWAEWTGELPDKFTAELDPARTIGGIVVDAKGNPVAGAKVHPSVKYKKRPGDSRALGSGVALTTDERGYWSYSHLPIQSSSFTVEITHPDFKSTVTQLAADTFELRNGQSPSQSVTLDSGIAVHGKIVDLDGQPVEGALVRTKFLNDIRSATTDSAGVYRLLGCDESTAKIVVSAKGKATDMQVVNIVRDMPPVDFKMQPGGHVRIRVIDEDGNPIPQARIFFQGWRDARFQYFEFDHVSQYADEQGIWEWNEAPLDEFQADICRPGGMQLGHQPLISRKDEYVFSPPPMLVIVGKVIDAQTQEPIKVFEVVPGVRSDPQNMNWVPQNILVAKDGTFELKHSHDYFAHLVKVQARGFLPIESRDIKSDEGRVELTFELQRGKDIDMRVMTPKGLPAQGARVALGIPGSQISIRNGDIDDESTYAERAVVNAAGRFRFPPQTAAYRVLITHEEGFALFDSTEAERMDLVRLTPWARAAGTFRVAGEPQAGVTMSLDSDSGVHSYGDDVPNVFTHSETVTDTEGNFVFERVFPGPGHIRRAVLRLVGEGAKEVTSSTALPGEFRSKETTRIEFGLSGIAVVGQLLPIPGSDQPTPWSFADVAVQPTLGPGEPPYPDNLDEGQKAKWLRQWLQTPPGTQWREANAQANRDRRTSPRYTATVDRQGKFRFDDLPPGSYELSARFWEKSDNGSLAWTPFTIPAHSQEPILDLGQLQLK